MSQLSENLWQVSGKIKDKMLYAGESIDVGDFGVHTSDWSSFDKSENCIAISETEYQSLAEIDIVSLKEAIYSECLSIHDFIGDDLIELTGVYQ